MPDRIIHEQAVRSHTLDVLSDGAERYFWRQTVKADDQGRFDAAPQLIVAACFPLRAGRMRLERVELWRDECAAAGLIDLYWVGEHLYGAFRTWDKWQRQRDSKPKRPGPSAPEAAPYVSRLLTPDTHIAANGGHSPQVAATRGRDSRAVSRDSRAVSREAGGGRRSAASSGGEAPPLAADAGSAHTEFQIPPSILRAIDGAPRLSAVAVIRRPEFWQAEIRANPGLDLAREVRKAEAYLVSNPEKRYERLGRFLHAWFRRAERDTEGT